MICHSCKTKIDTEANFCTNCGLASKPMENIRDNNDNSREESLAMWRKMKRTKTVQASIFACIAAALGCLIGWLFSGSYWGMSFGALLLGSVVFQGYPSITKKNYYSLPYSRGVRNAHRCIFCGHHGIFKTGQYKTTKTHSSCSSCQEFLYTD